MPAGDSDREILQEARNLVYEERETFRGHRKKVLEGLDRILLRYDTMNELRAERFDGRPLSVMHHRGLRTDLAKDWTPRDLLIDCLRRLDAGEEVMRECMVVAMVDSDTSSEGSATSVRSACSSTLMSIALLSQAMMIKGS